MSRQYKVAIVAAAISLSVGFASEVRSADLTVHAGSIGGTFFIMGAAFSGQWQNNIDGFRASVVPGGSVTNILNVQRHPDGSHVGITVDSLMQEAWEHRGEFATLATGPARSIRTLANLGYGQALQFVMLAEVVPDGIETIEEYLATQPAVNISVGQRGSNGELGVRRTLEFHGIDYETISQWGGSIQFSDYNDAFNGMRDGRIQGFWQVIPAFHPGVTELSISRDLTLLALGPETARHFIEDFAHSPFVIPAGSYNGLAEDVSTVFVPTMLIAHEALDRELVRQMTMEVLTNRESWVSAFRGMETFDPATAWQSPVPLHEGAADAYRELGYID